jgi:hypothetical protein
MTKIVTAMLVVWMALSYGLITVLASSSDGIPGDGGVITTGERPVTVSPSPARVPDEHIERHALMTSQMRIAGPEARMPARMTGDPMWQMMFSPAHIRAEEEYHRRIDRMLARTP